MTDEEKVLLIRLLIGDTENSPFYPLFTNEEIESFLLYANGDVTKAARTAAISASMQLSGQSSKERIGDLEIWNSLSSGYLASLKYFINNPDYKVPEGLFAWSASNGSYSKLLNITLCGEKCGPKVRGAEEKEEFDTSNFVTKDELNSAVFDEGEY